MKTKSEHNYFFGSMPEMPWKKETIMDDNIYKPRPDCQTPGLAEIYAGVFGQKIDGVFVEIGANDGISWSNTIFLAELGWTGLYVDPIEHLYTKCVQNHEKHPNITIFKATVGDGSRVAMHRQGYTDDLYTGNPAFAKANHANNVIGEFPTVRMDDLLEMYDFQKHFDLAVIDVEGMEVDVLKGWAIERWMPKLVIVETCELNRNLAIPGHNDYINTYFVRYYTKIYTSAINTIFLRVYHV